MANEKVALLLIGALLFAAIGGLDAQRRGGRHWGGGGGGWGRGGFGGGGLLGGLVLGSLLGGGLGGYGYGYGNQLNIDFQL
ncbi:hypothetical protein DPMN_166382 [Dreissena polymorpha]|uniref:Uncharacterized protein n=1 Tax=Dreissena polymorpha TaxID=45954 RepID=A0A9D4EXV6_DREPO|nr:hypothetical protein DPMN_166382 [Dreissena polymorpha]